MSTLLDVPEDLAVRTTEQGFPYIPSFPQQTPAGTPFLTAPGVHLISFPQVDFSSLSDFLEGYGPELEFGDYLNDPTELDPTTALTKLAGQNCYASWGPKRSTNAQAGKYVDNIKSSGHGSVLEHANITFLIYGISRSETHEDVRHRAGRAFSQLSQRYVSGKVLRFVERPEYQANPVLHERFVQWIDAFAQEYDWRSEHLLAEQSGGSEIMSAEARTDRRKKVQQAARSVLPNETETTMVTTGNVRAWRHFIEMRANAHAEIEIRSVALRIYLCLVTIAPLLFSDYTIIGLPDGTYAVDTPYRKV
jgi:thymidylate synthase (FAD)